MNFELKSEIQFYPSRNQESLDVRFDGQILVFKYPSISSTVIIA